MCLTISMIPVGMIGGLEGVKIATAFLGLIIVITFFVAFVMSYFITHPLEKLTKNIDNISKGNLDVELERSEIYEINNLTDSLNRVMTSLKLAIHKVGVKKGEIFEETIKAKEAAEEKYETLLKCMGAWTWKTDEKGVCTACSPKISETLGYAIDEIVGKKMVMFISPEESKKFKEMHTEVSAQNKEKTVELSTCFIHKSGNPVYIQTRATPIFDHEGIFRGFNGMGRDISEYKCSEEKIRELNEKIADMKERMHLLLNDKKIDHRKTLDTTKQEFDYMFLFDEKAHIIEGNPNFFKKLGYSKEELPHLHLKDVDYLESTEEIQQKMNQIKKQEKTMFKTIHKKKDGSSLFVQENISYLKNKNLFRCVVREDNIKT